MNLPPAYPHFIGFAPIRRTKRKRRCIAVDGFVLWLIIGIFLTGSIHGQSSTQTDGNTTDIPGSSQDAIVSKTDEVSLVDDSNLAEALDRRPDLKFQNVIIDGERATVSLANLPADAVDSAEVMKAVTADLDADSRGGSLSLRSKPSFDLEKRLIKGELRIGYNSLFDEITGIASLTYGQSMGEKKRFGFRGTGTLKHRIQGSDNIEVEWKENHDGVFVMKKQFLEQFRRTTNDREFNATFDYKLRENFTVYFRASYETEKSDFYVPQFRLQYDVDDDDTQSDYVEADANSAYVKNAKIKRDLRGFEGIAEEYSVATGGYIDGKRLNIDYRIAKNSEDYHEPDYFVIEFARQGVDVSYDLEDRSFPGYQVENGVDLTDPDEFAFDEVLSQLWVDNSSDFISTVNFKLKRETEPGFYKFGAKFRSRDAEHLADSRVYDEFDGNFLLSDVLSTFSHSGHIGGHYDELGPAPSLSESRAFLRDHLDDFTLNIRKSREDSDPGTYNAKENVTAAYAMANFEFGKWRTLTGLRMEKTDISFTGNEVIIDSNGEYLDTNRIDGTRSYTNYFPGVHARYKLNDAVTVIGSWTRTIKRPDYEDLVPYRYVNRENKELEEGNPDLRPTFYSNYDLSVDIEFNPRTTYSVEFFYRKVENFLFWRETDVSGGPFDGYERERLENGPDAKVAGTELTLSLQPRFLDGLKVNLNYVYTASEIEYPNRLGEFMSLTYTPESKLSATVTYEKGKIFGQAKLMHESDYIVSVDDSAKDDIYAVGETHLNLSFSYELNAQARLFAEIENAVGQPFDLRYEGDSSRPSRYRLAPRIMNFGIKFEL